MRRGRATSDAAARSAENRATASVQAGAPEVAPRRRLRGTSGAAAGGSVPPDDRVATVAQAGPELEELERRITSGMHALRSAAFEIGEALREIRDRELYKVNFDSFEDYARVKHGISRASSYRFIDCAIVLDVLRRLPGETPLPTNEKQVRPLVRLLRDRGEEAVAVAWQRAVSVASPDAPTASGVLSAILDRDFYRRQARRAEPTDAKRQEIERKDREKRRAEREKTALSIFPPADRDQIREAAKRTRLSVESFIKNATRAAVKATGEPTVIEPAVKPSLADKLRKLGVELVSPEQRARVARPVPNGSKRARASRFVDPEPDDVEVVASRPTPVNP